MLSAVACSQGDGAFHKQKPDCSRKSEVEVMEDFNYPDISWNTIPVTLVFPLKFRIYVTDIFLLQRVKKAEIGQLYSIFLNQ